MVTRPQYDDQIQVKHCTFGHGVFSQDRLEHTKTIPDTIVAQCLEGRYEVWAEGQHALIEPGDFFLLAPMRTIRIIHHCPETGPMRARWVMFQALQFGQLDIFAPYQFPLHAKASEAKELVGSFQTLFELQQDKPPQLPQPLQQPFQQGLHTSVLDAIVHQQWMYTLIVALLKSAQLIEKQHEKLHTLAPVYRFIELHLAEPISVADLADCVHLSEARFYVVFKQITKMSPKAWLQKVRMERVAHLLLSSDGGLEQIAMSCGLANAFHLSRLFKQWSGVTPSAWRKEQRSGWF